MTTLMQSRSGPVFTSRGNLMHAKRPRGGDAHQPRDDVMGGQASEGLQTVLAVAMSSPATAEKRLPLLAESGRCDEGSGCDEGSQARARQRPGQAVVRTTLGQDCWNYS